MRLLMAALLAAVVSLGGTLLFSSYFDSIELRTESDGETVAKRQHDTRTQDDRCGIDVECPEIIVDYFPCEATNDCPERPTRRQLLVCNRQGLTDYHAPQIVELARPTLPFVEELDMPIHRVLTNFCISNTGNAFDITALGRPTNLFDRSAVEAIEESLFLPAASKLNSVQVCGCEIDLTFDRSG